MSLDVPDVVSENWGIGREVAPCRNVMPPAGRLFHAQGMQKGFAQCARQGCGHIFRQESPSKEKTCCSKSCARKMEAENRLGLNVADKKAQLFAAMDAEFDRIFKR